MEMQASENLQDESKWETYQNGLSSYPQDSERRGLTLEERHWDKQDK